jgi:hypothetical protein
MPRRLSAFMGEHPTRAAGGPSCAALEFVRAVRDWFSGRRKEARPCPAPSFPGESARRLGRRGMCAGRDDGLRAGLLPRGGETASDDVAAAGDLPVPVAGCAVRANVVRKYGIPSLGDGIQGLGFEEQHDTSPAWARHPDPRAAHREVNATAAQSTCSNCSSGQLFCGQNCSLWSFNLRRLFVQNSIQQ